MTTTLQDKAQHARDHHLKISVPENLQCPNHAECLMDQTQLFARIRAFVGMPTGGGNGKMSLEFTKWLMSLYRRGRIDAVRLLQADPVIYNAARSGKMPSAVLATDGMDSDGDDEVVQ